MKLNKLYLFIIFLSLCSVQTFGQLIDFTIPNTVCLNQNISVQNTSSGFENYSWDFCEGDLKIPPLASSHSYSGFNVPVGTSLIQAEGLWYGFICSLSGNEIVRIDFGNDLTNVDPVINNLGNAGGALNFPQDIKVVNDNGVFYAFTYNRGSNQLVRINFGADLRNVSPSSDILLSGNGYENGGLDVKYDGTNWVVALTNANTLTLINLGSSAGNIPSTGDILSTSPISGINGIGDIKLVSEAGNWFGIAVGFNSRSVHRLSFGNNLFTDPASEQLNIPDFDASGLQPFGITGAWEDNEWIFFLSTSQGSIPRLNFGNQISNNNIEYLNLGNLSVLSSTLKIDMAVFESRWIAITSSWNTTNFYLIEFPQVTCGFNKAFSTSVSDTIQSVMSGSSSITLRAKNNNRFYDQTTKSILVKNTVAPAIDIITDNVCVDNSITFIPYTSNDDTLISWSWNFGDGSPTSTDPNPSHTYAAAGIYDVTLNVQSINGCNNFTRQIITIYNEPIPDFSVPLGNICMNNPIVFTNTSTIDAGAAVSWTWDFNGEGNSTENEPSFTFDTPGVKNITLTTSIPGCANVIQKSITIEDAPTTSFSFNNACNTAATLFQDQTVGNNLTNWSWDFGDGNVSIEQNPIHTYTTAGKYTVTLTVGNALGCTTTKVDTVYNHAVPVVGFEYDLPCSNVAVQFTDTTLVQDANIVTWEWDFGDPESVNNTSTNQYPQHTYSSIGDYTVTLTAYSQFGCYDITQSTISVSQAPEVAFSWNKACLGDPTTFEDLTNSFGMPINSWVWLIDGQIFTEQHPQYTFSTNGIHTVQLSVTTNNLCTQTAFQDIEINNPPITSFNYSKSCTNDQVLFYDTTINLLDVVTSREWRIDGQVVSTDSTMQVSMIPGDYIITLSTMTLNGCEESISKSITISGSPQSQFSANTELGAFPLEIIFNNESLVSKKYFWEFGDDNKSTSSEENPSFTYHKPGEYLVNLISENDIGCTDTTSMAITVVEPILNAALTNLSVIEDNSKSKFLLRISNPGTILLNEANLDIVFELRDNVEIVEPFRNIIHAEKSINYLPAFSIGSNGDAKLLCVYLKTHHDNLEDENIWDNRQCHNFDNEPIISDVFPNPTNRFFNISVILSEAQNIRINILDQKGKVLSSDEKLSVPKGLANFVIDAQNYHSGIYYINVIAGNNSEVRKVIVDK